MRLPSSSSLLLASLAVSSSSSSLSALAAPTGDGTEDSPAVLPCGDDAAAQSNNHLQSRGLIPQSLGEPVKKILDGILGARSESVMEQAADKLAARGEAPQDSPTPPAPQGSEAASPGDSAPSPAAPANNPSLPVKLPVAAPPLPPGAPALPVPPIGRGDSGGLAGFLPLPLPPPNTPQPGQ